MGIGRVEERSNLDDFDYHLPPELIATQPASPRDSCRLMVLDTAGRRWEHRLFGDLPEYLTSKDCLILNQTKVWPARLIGKKTTGGKADILVLRPAANQEPRTTNSHSHWLALGQNLRPGQRLLFPEGVQAQALDKTPNGEWVCEFSHPDLGSYLERHGSTPLPHYILKKRPPNASDRETYQTVYAQSTDYGLRLAAHDSPSFSVAAPTAGLHFTPELLKRIGGKGVSLAFLTLHIGWGTFKPIRTQDIRRHKMLPEYYEVSPGCCAKIAEAGKRGGRLIAVGTSVARALETAAQDGAAALQPRQGWSDMFLYPGRSFRLVGGLLTNFHIPRSTPLVLVSAFAGRENILDAYREAIEKGYRFYSYGDAMLIL